jgi:hypothetical protein
MTQEVECLPSKHKATGLELKSSIAQINKYIYIYIHVKAHKTVSPKSEFHCVKSETLQQGKVKPQSSMCTLKETALKRTDGDGATNTKSEQLFH